jgi:GNAT superfamily N-acetyltransferase
VFDQEGVVIGFFALETIGSENRLDHLWIEPERIRQGFGRQLFQEAVIAAKSLGWASFRLAADPPAEEFYLKMGARRIGDVQSRIKPDLLLPHMEYVISPENFH